MYGIDPDELIDRAKAGMETLGTAGCQSSVDVGPASVRFYSSVSFG